MVNNSTFKPKDNIVVIIGDCLRFDHVCDDKLMPFLDKLGQENHFCRKAYTNAPSTHFAVPALLTGYMPLEKTNKAEINPNMHSRYLPLLLKEKGYKTFGVTANVVASSFFGYAHGFDFYQDFLDRKGDEVHLRKIMGIKAKIPKGLKKTVLLPFKKIFNKLVKMQNVNIANKIRGKDILNELQKNEFQKTGNFIFLHFMEPHTPYAPLAQKKHFGKITKLTKILYENPSKFSQTDINFLKKMYKEECGDLDKILQETISFLKSKLDWGRSKLVILADHGEAFGETGYFVHPGFKTDNLKHHIRIPLITKGFSFDANKIYWLQDVYEMLSSEKLPQKYPFCVGVKRKGKKTDVKSMTYQVTEINDLERVKKIDAKEEIYT